MPDTTLPPFPVDDFTLDQVEHSLSGAYEVTDDGEHRWVGSDFPLPRLLDFLSGYNEDRSVHIGYAGGTPIYEHLDPVYSERDLTRALIAEVRRLRDGT